MVIPIGCMCLHGAQGLHDDANCRWFNTAPDLCTVCGASWECEHREFDRVYREGLALTERLQDSRQSSPKFSRRPRAIRVPKFIRGEVFATVGEMCQWIVDGGWVYEATGAMRPSHPEWMLSQPLRTLKSGLGRIRRALPNPEYQPDA